jgi:hypothetical protein
VINIALLILWSVVPSAMSPRNNLKNQCNEDAGGAFDWARFLH